MLDKIYWWVINIWYKLFYSGKIVSLLLSDKFEQGDMLMPHHMVIINDPYIEGQGYIVHCISTKYQITKQEFWETIILSTLVLLFVGFLIYIF